MAITVESRRLTTQGGYALNVPIGGTPTDILVAGDEGGVATFELQSKLKIPASAGAGKYLQSDALGNASWVTITALTDPMTTRGDVIIRNASNVTARLPIGASGYVLKSDGTDVSWGAVSAAVATAVTVANEATDTTCFPLFATAATGDLGPKSNAALTFNSNTGELGASIGSFTTLKLGGTTITASGAELNFVDGVTSAVQLQLDGKQQFHGVEAYGALSFDNSTHVLSIAAGTNTYWYLGTKFTTASAITCDLDSYVTLTSRTLYYIYFDDATGTLKAGTTFWDLYTKVPVATVFWNGSAGATIKEYHGHKRDPGWHTNAHLTIGCRYLNNGGLAQTAPTTAADSTLQIETGTLYDEDLPLVIAQSTTMRGWYQYSSGVYTFADYSLPYLGTAGAPVYLDTDTYTLTTFASNRFACYWVYGCGDISRGIYVIPSAVSTPYTTVALARAETPPSLIGLNISAEMKLLYRWIYAGDGQYQEGADYRASSVLPGGGAATTAAASVTFIASGNIEATNVQAAIEEVDTEKAAVGQTFYIGTTQVAINRASAALTLAGLTLTTPDIGTPSAGTLTNCTGLPVAGITASTSTALGVGSIELGHASDTTLARVSAGVVSIEGSNIIVSGGALGTPSGGTLTNCTGLPIAGLTQSTATAIGVGTIELGHATDTTISRSAAGVIAVEGVVIPSISSTNTLTNKDVQPRVVTTTDDSTAVIDLAVTDHYQLTAVANATTFSTTGSVINGKRLLIRFKDAGGAKGLTWDGIFRVIGVTLPTTTVPNKTHYVLSVGNTADTKMDVLAVGVEA